MSKSVRTSHTLVVEGADAGDDGGAFADPAPTTPVIPPAAVARLAGYLHVLRVMSSSGVMITSSGQLAVAAGVNSANLRKDLSYIGANGVRGVGYDVGRLIAKIAMALHTANNHNVALAGARMLGNTLLAHTGMGRGFTVVALFDDEPELIGTALDGPQDDASGLRGPGLTVDPMSEITDRCRELDVDVAVIATLDHDAQRVSDAFVDAGVKQILNVTSVTLRTPADVFVRPVDLALELQVLAFKAAQGRAHAAADRRSVTA
ncbi:redox-sensing transcriptional repressor Rex [Williamsia sterculiae]|uniref:Redox-sensing transcriptional repressor Rex n=1 Tax=Williamsia sterculiae TaxID=1344003 RepID=A0A1N7CW77_9NOCA|nr:redox-sensing transcriptional repressor Rex [Williamsia sterculiae]SIR67872.1 redox-sensing transcriptional repressor [Williamsia sterculiae]